VDKKIAEISNWLVIGPFANPNRKGIETFYAPEKELVFGKMYEGAEVANNLDNSESGGFGRPD
jgi:unsaturated rhamnogalacturonyl hydrolase